jgi:hypothetical protein
MTTAPGVTQPDTLIGGGVALATIGGVLMGVGASQPAGSHYDVWSSRWFDGGCALVACGVLVVVSALMVSWWRSRRRRAPAVRHDRGSGALSPDHEPPTASPLPLRLVDENWQLFYSAVWVFGLAVCATNLMDKPIILARYQLQSRTGVAQRPPLAQVVWDSVNAAKAHLSSDHQGELFAGEITVPPGGSVTRWYIDTAYVPLPDGGRPHCTFQIRDILDNAYELEIPARPPRIYRSTEGPLSSCARP